MKETFNLTYLGLFPLGKSPSGKGMGIKMKEYTQGITVDKVYFDVPLLSIQRSTEFMDKYTSRTEDGEMKRELIGVYYNYQMTFGIIDDLGTYEELFDKLTEPVEFHDFELPTTNGIYSFRGYIGGVSDSIEKVYDNTARFGGLKCSFTAKKPARKQISSLNL